jgi:single-strand DNA-binding protein
MSPTLSPKHSNLSPITSPTPAGAGDHWRAVCGPCSQSGDVVSATSWGPVQRSVSATAFRAGGVAAIGCIVGTHAAELSSPALRVAARVLSDEGLTARLAGAGSRLVSHTTRPEQRGKEDTMNRWTGTGHLTKDPRFLETEDGTAICTLRIAVKRAGKQGHDGYFDVKCFDAQASACAQYLKAGREIAVDGRLLFDEFQTQDGSYASRIYIVAERVEFLASRKRPNGQAGDEASTDKPAGDGVAREADQAA